MIRIIIILVVIGFVLIEIFRRITKKYFNTYRVVEKPREEDPDKKYYIIEQLTNRGWKEFNWGSNGKFRYRGFISEELKNIYRNNCVHGWTYKYYIYFDSAESANKALKIMIEFKRKVDNMPEAKVIKEVTYE